MKIKFNNNIKCNFTATSINFIKNFNLKNTSTPLSLPTIQHLFSLFIILCAHYNFIFTFITLLIVFVYANVQCQSRYICEVLVHCKKLLIPPWGMVKNNKQQGGCKKEVRTDTKINVRGKITPSSPPFKLLKIKTRISVEKKK